MSFLLSVSSGSFLVPLGEVVVVDVWDIWVGAEGVLSFKECVSAAVVQGVTGFGEVILELELEHKVAELVVVAGCEMMFGVSTGEVCLTGWTEKVTLVGEVELGGDAWAGVKTCFGLEL